LKEFDADYFSEVELVTTDSQLIELDPVPKFARGELEFEKPVLFYS